MKYETFDQPAYGVGDLETFGITDNSGSLVMDFSSDNGMESWRADSLLSEDLQAYAQVSRSHEIGGDGGTIPPPPPPPPPGSDDDDTSTDDSSGDTSGSGDTGSGDDEEDTVVIEQGYDPAVEWTQELLSRDTPDFIYQTEFGKLLGDYSSKLDPSAIVANKGSNETEQDVLVTINNWENAQEQKKQDYWEAVQEGRAKEFNKIWDQRYAQQVESHVGNSYHLGGEVPSSKGGLGTDCSSTSMIAAEEVSGIGIRDRTAHEMFTDPKLLRDSDGGIGSLNFYDLDGDEHIDHITSNTANGEVHPSSNSGTIKLIDQGSIDSYAEKKHTKAYNWLYIFYGE